MDEPKLQMETTEPQWFGVQFVQPDGTYRGLLPDGTPHPHPDAAVDLFDCLNDEAKARFRRGYRLVLCGQVAVLNLTPQSVDPEQDLKTS